MKPLLFVCAILFSGLSFSQEASVESSTDPNLWSIILNCSIGAICVLFAVFLLLGLRQIRKSFIPG